MSQLRNSELKKSFFIKSMLANLSNIVQEEEIISIILGRKQICPHLRSETLSPVVVRDISQHPWDKADSRGTQTCRIVCQHLIVEKSMKKQNFNIYCISFSFYQVEMFLAIVRKNHGIFCYSGNS